jgi:6-phosphogluconolactonase
MKSFYEVQVVHLELEFTLSKVSKAHLNRRHTMGIMINFHPYDDVESVAQAAADALALRILDVLGCKQYCHLVLPGGTTPVRCLELLAQKTLPWGLIHCYVSDERCLPNGDSQRNDVMIERALWSRVSLPEKNKHPMAAELGAEVAALRYAELIGQIDRLDIVLLGMGEDGHTASLFPGNAALDNPALAVAVANAPKPPPNRVSLGLSAIRRATERHLIVTGQSKYEAMRQIRRGVDLPVCRIGKAYWYVDRAATCQ